MNTLNLITIAASAVIVIAFALACIYILHKKGKNELLQNRQWIEQLPSMLSTFGVLGTFIGITVGLYDFDPTPDQLQNSITDLLGGLKTAFVTSLLGMICSLILNRIVNHALDTCNQGTSESAIATQKLTEAIRALQKSNESKSSELIAAVKDLKVTDTLKQLRLDVMQLKDDVEEIKGSHEYMREIQSKEGLNIEEIGEILQSIKSTMDALDQPQADENNASSSNNNDLAQLRAIAMTSTASVAKLDNTVEAIRKELSSISEAIAQIAEDVEERNIRK